MGPDEVFERNDAVDKSCVEALGSPLSLPYLLEEAAPALAADGDPSTEVPALG